MQKQQPPPMLVTKLGAKQSAVKPTSIKAAVKPGASARAPSRPPLKPDQYTEYKLRVPRNLVRRYNVMKINNPRPIKLENIKEANMVRKTKKQVYVEEEGPAMPTYGAGSVYNYERKEEARKKRRGYVTKEVNPEDLPYALRLDGKGGKRYTGRKEPILDHCAYYVLTQTPEGVFEAIPVQAWYNFMPDIDYNTLTADEVEHEFSKRDRTLSYFTKKYQLGTGEEDGASSETKVKRTNDGVGLVIHDDDLDANGDEDFDDPPSDSENKKKKPAPAKSKNIYRGKKRKGAKNDDDGTQDSDEEEDLDNLESKEVDYMSESSSEDELMEMDDEPDPEKNTSEKAKDDLNIFSDSDTDEEDDKQLNDAGKELKAMLKKESGGGSSDEEDEDEDIDSEYSKSAIFIQGKDGKKKKGKNGSNNGSKPTSRSSTPVQLAQDQTSDTLNQAAKSLKEAGSKRHIDSSTPSPNSKKQKLSSIATSSKRSNSPLTITSERSASPAVRSGTPADGQAITEDAIRRYLSLKPMTTTGIMKKFKKKKTGLSKEQTVSAIAAILTKIKPHQEKIDGKLYLSIKPK